MTSNLTIAGESFESLSKYNSDPNSGLNWNLVFTLPAWMRVWWKNFGTSSELYLKSFKQGARLSGIAPLQIKDHRASIIGSVNVCDYQDFLIVPGQEDDFFEALLDDLNNRGIRGLDLETVRPDSSVTKYLIPLAKNRGYSVDYQKVDVSLDMVLPDDWQKYLDSLDGKQRHELRRKMRNLQSAGETQYRVLEDKNAIAEGTDTFLKLFPDYRQDKADFMTSEMQTYFRSLAESLADSGILKYGLLEIDHKAVAMIMYFDYNNNIYLYNSAYAPEYKTMSVGVISKARCIQDSIEKKKVRFDFLKGNEQYKYYMGGQEIPLYNYRIALQ